MFGPNQGRTEADRSRNDQGLSWPRRRLLAALGLVALGTGAGCVSGEGATEPGDGSTDGDGDESGSGDGDSDSADGSNGTFRLLISDQPVAIDEFESLEVTFDGARIFRSDSDADGTDSVEDADDDEGNDDDGGEDGDDGDGGFVTVELDDPTVDLTTVVGEKAIGVFDGELAEGSYSKIELSVSAVDGVVDGESVAVQVPSERLQIVKPFDVVAEETIEFVFDITVVRRGQAGGYNLLPVIGESGVVGRDVEIEEIEVRNEDDGGERDRSDRDPSGPE